MRKKTPLIIAALSALILVVGCYAWHQSKNDGQYVWARYENKAFGFSIEYPSNILVPTSPELTEIDFELQNNPTRTTPPISVWMYSTTAPDIRAWIQSEAKTREIPISTYTMTTIAGVEAANVGNYSFSFVHEGKVWNLLIFKDFFSSRDAERIKQSFQFAN